MTAATHGHSVDLFSSEEPTENLIVGVDRDEAEEVRLDLLSGFDVFAGDSHTHSVVPGPQHGEVHESGQKPCDDHEPMTERELVQDPSPRRARIWRQILDGRDVRAGGRHMDPPECSSAPPRVS